MASPPVEAQAGNSTVRGLTASPTRACFRVRARAHARVQRSFGPTRLCAGARGRHQSLSHSIPAHAGPARHPAAAPRPPSSARCGRARVPTRAPRARARTSHGPRSATRRTRVDRGGPSARPRAARALAAALIPYLTPPPNAWRHARASSGDGVPEALLQEICGGAGGMVKRCVKTPVSSVSTTRSDGGCGAWTGLGGDMYI